MSGQDLLLSQGALAAMTAVSLGVGLLLGALYSILRWLSTFLEADTYRALLRRVSQKRKTDRRKGTGYPTEAVSDGIPEEDPKESPTPPLSPSRWPPLPPDGDSAAPSGDETVTEGAVPASRQRPTLSLPRFGSLAQGVTDFLWTVIAWIALILVLYYTNDGQFRAPAPVCMAVGVLLYSAVLGKWAEKARVPLAVAVLYPLCVLLIPLWRAAKVLRDTAKQREGIARKAKQPTALTEKTANEAETGNDSEKIHPKNGKNRKK